ncbi:hypothetical protein [Streptomyces sp. NPDC047000]|uniref:hypothetical protein n=1 Tax=Streptomyces sp. NPDC047000 TaxID=3155474 RepID=UPI0034016BF0
MIVELRHPNDHEARACSAMHPDRSQPHQRHDTGTRPNPATNRLALVQANRLAAAVLLRDWQATRTLLLKLIRTESCLCVLRGTVLAAESVTSDVLHRRWRREALGLGAEAVAGLEMPHEATGKGFHDCLMTFLERGPSGRTLLEKVSVFLSPLSAGSCQGAALASAVLLAASLTVSDPRTPREPAREQVALISAFMNAGVITHDDDRVHGFD